MKEFAGLLFPSKPLTFGILMLFLVVVFELA
jgi:hypothetical protein